MQDYYPQDDSMGEDSQDYYGGQQGSGGGGFGFPQQNMMQPTGGGPNQLQMAGLLLASGMPFDQALVASAHMQRQQAAAGMQQYKFQMAQQKLLQQQSQQQANDAMFNQLLNGGSSSNAGMPSPNAGMPTGNANTLAEANAMSGDPAQLGSSGEQLDTNSPNNIYTQMDDPNRVPGANIGSLGSAMRGAPMATSGAASTGASTKVPLSQETKNMAILMWQSGDKRGAIKLLQAAQTPTDVNGFVKNPMMGPARGGQGGTYVNQQTGETISSDTSKNTTTDQLTIAALQRVDPQVKRLMEVMPQFQQAGTAAKSYTQGLSNKYLNTDYKLPSERAEGEAILKAAPESLLKAYGLNVTNESLKSMEDMIKPGDGESPDGYRARLTRNLAEMEMFGEQAKLRLANGTTIKTPKTTQNSNSNAAPISNNSPNNMTYNLEDLKAERARRQKLKSGR